MCIRDRDAVVTAFNDEVDLIKHCFHLVEACFVMAEEVGAGEGGEGGKCATGDELGCGCEGYVGSGGESHFGYFLFPGDL